METLKHDSYESLSSELMVSIDVTIICGLLEPAELPTYNINPFYAELKLYVNIQALLIVRPFCIIHVLFLNKH